MISIIYYNCEKFERTYFIYFRKDSDKFFNKLHSSTLKTFKNLVNSKKGKTNNEKQRVSSKNQFQSKRY